jgi:hypothetical protein
MKGRWQALRDEVDERRRDPAHDVQTLRTGVIRRLKRLSEAGHCSPNAVGWLQHRRVASVTRIELKHGDARDAWGHPAVKLRGLRHLEEGALLTFSIDVGERRSELVSYSVSVIGERRHEPATATAAGPRPFYTRIDLDDAPKGKGLCGHALLHCHVGDDPGPNKAFSPRVPLPWLHPADALDWILSAIHPPLEP